MERRDFLVGAGTLAATTTGLRGLAQDDPEAVKDTIRALYSYYAALDKAKYRAVLTEDYVLLENGEVLDISGDLALMPASGAVYRRTDAFDFRSVRVRGEMAYAVYFLTSEITDPTGARHRKWLESVILRRAGNGWRVALLHSTRIPTPGG
jgi:ketosteroid isomerase-like protein